MDNEAKLDAIRAAARREAAERKQREQADARREARGNQQPPRVTLWHGLGLAIVVVAAYLLAGPWLDDTTEQQATSNSDQWNELSEARKKAVAVAGGMYLISRGANLDDLTLVSSTTEDGDTYRLTYRHQGKDLVLFARRKCDRLALEQLQRPGCWDWY